MSSQRKRLGMHEVSPGELVTKHFVGENNAIYLVNKTYKRGKTFDTCEIDTLLPFKDRKDQRVSIQFKRDTKNYFLAPNEKELKAALNGLNEKIARDPDEKLGHGVRLVMNKIEEELSDLGYKSLMTNKQLPQEV